MQISSFSLRAARPVVSVKPRFGTDETPAKEESDLERRQRISGRMTAIAEHALPILQQRIDQRQKEAPLGFEIKLKPIIFVRRASVTHPKGQFEATKQFIASLPGMQPKYPDSRMKQFAAFAFFPDEAKPLALGTKPYDNLDYTTNAMTVLIDDTEATQPDAEPVGLLRRVGQGVARFLVG